MFQVFDVERDDHEWFITEEMPYSVSNSTLIHSAKHA